MTTTTKVCTKCGVEKPVGEFGRHKSGRDGLNSRCRACRAADWRGYYQANRDSVAEQRRKYRETNRDAVAAIERRWCEANRDRVAAKQRRYYEANSLRVRLREGARRARKAGVRVEKITSAELLAYWESCGIAADRCHYTGAALGDGWHLDHAVPISRGGSHSLDNLVPCAPAANVEKGQRTADEYLEYLAEKSGAPLALF